MIFPAMTKYKNHYIEIRRYDIIPIFIGSIFDEKLNQIDFVRFDIKCEFAQMLKVCRQVIDDIVINDKYNIVYDDKRGLDLLYTSDKLDSIVVSIESKTFIFDSHDTITNMYIYRHIPKLDINDRIYLNNETIPYTVRFIRHHSSYIEYYYTDEDMKLYTMIDSSLVTSLERDRPQKQKCNKQISVRIPQYLFDMLQNTIVSEFVNKSLYDSINKMLQENK